MTRGEEALPSSLCSGNAGEEAPVRAQPLEKLINWVVNALQDLPGSGCAPSGVDILRGGQRMHNGSLWSALLSTAVVQLLHQVVILPLSTDYYCSVEGSLQCCRDFLNSTGVSQIVRGV